MHTLRLLVITCCLGATLIHAADEHPGQTFKTDAVTLYYETLGSAPGTPLVVANGGPGFDHSWGGYLVMAYAARYPQHIRRLLIVDSGAPKLSDTIFLFKDVFPEGVAREDAAEFASQMGDKAARIKSLREYFSMLFYSPEKRDVALAKLTDVDENVAVNEAITHDLERFDLNPELPKYSFPAIVMTGRYDINVAAAVAYRIHKAIPGSQFAVFDQSGHLPFYEEPAKFLQTVESFLK